MHSISVRAPLRIGRAGRILATVVAAASFILGGCTALPTQQFSTYKETFAKARAAGEEVLVDYSATRAKVVELEASKRASRPADTDRPTRIPPASASEASQIVDHVAVRMQAWDVVARFNEALTGLAEGRSASEVAAASDGLLQSLNTFPVDAVKELGGDLVPFAGAIRGLITAAETERSKQQFLQAFSKYGPVIREQFIGLLKKDIDDFYRIRFGLNDRDYLGIVVDDIGKAIGRFKELAQKHQYTAELQGVAGALNSTLAGLPRSPEKTAILAEFKNVTDALSKSTSTTPPDALTIDKLQRIREEIGNDVTRALAKNAELTPYGEVLANYRALLDRTARSLKALEDAVANGTRSEPPSDELLKAVIMLRQAFVKYQENR